MSSQPRTYVTTFTNLRAAKFLGQFSHATLAGLGEAGENPAGSRHTAGRRVCD